MRLLDLGALYLLVGVGCAIALRLRRSGATSAWTDALLTATLWPLVLPTRLGATRAVVSPNAPRIEHERALLVTALDLARARLQPGSLGTLLPNAAQVDRLMRHLEGLDAKVHELDEVLSGEEFAPTHAERRLREGDRAGAGSAADALRRLTALRARAAQERDDLLALCARLRMQVTVLRFAEGAADDDLGELVHELLARVEGAGAAMEGEPASQRPTDGARVGVSSPA